MERNEISIHEVRVFQFLKASGGRWLTAKDVSEGANVAHRTARAHMYKFVKLGIVDQAEVFPAHRYRLAEKASKRNASYMLRLAAASEVFQA